MNSPATHRSDTYVFIAYWLFASPIILASFDVGDITHLDVAVYYAYMVVAYSGAAWIVVHYLLPQLTTTWGLFATMPALFALLITVATGTFVLDYFILPNPPTWWRATWGWNLANDSQNVLTIVAILAAKRFIVERQRALVLESERSQSELQRLRAQVDPHFLFNSLNILDILIEDDPGEARHFVHRLSNLYRYLIRHRDEDLVPVADELQYAADYHYLVERRFGNSFTFRQNITSEDLDSYYVPPGSLQTVLENVYKHNLATERNPVTITLDKRDDVLFVTNDYSPKPGGLATHEQSGSGTANLLRRYALLTDREVYSRREGEHWVARLPLLRATQLAGTKSGEVAAADPVRSA